MAQEQQQSHLVEMEHELTNYDSSMRDGNVERLVKKTNKCNQCDYASSQVGHLKRHLKTHSGERSNKCNQCDFVSSQAGHLKTHLKIHSGEKPNKCTQCDYASSQVGDLMRHLKTHRRELEQKQTMNEGDVLRSTAKN